MSDFCKDCFTGQGRQKDELSMLEILRRTLLNRRPERLGKMWLSFTRAMLLASASSTMKLSLVV
ncbi:hypothetical protein PILCRDRAFT_636075 [Piloderma croceum F 1598]|uniref:Uncharacterized protein n=1 Tax=Piloderma croceum (strain F 1598) TaxID=765440 RepID=A0A0C3BHU7_PILCF|nr:hypothetical protein PILCRDRAFT_636075 [Piloderma croceum F 1598]